MQYVQKEIALLFIRNSTYRPLSFLCAPVTLVVWSPDEDDTIRGSARLPNLNIVGTPRLVMAWKLRNHLFNVSSTALLQPWKEAVMAADWQIEKRKQKHASPVTLQNYARCR